MKFQSNLILPLLIGLSACNWSGQKGYDSYFLDLINKANKNGDPNAAEEAYDYCQSILKLDNMDLPSGYIGQCGGVLALWTSLAVESGDAEEIKAALASAAYSKPDLSPRVPLLRSMAKLTIQERCLKEPSSPQCANDALLLEFGIDRPGALTTDINPTEEDGKEKNAR